MMDTAQEIVALRARVSALEGRIGAVLEGAARVEKQRDNTLAAFENMKRELHIAQEAFASLKHSIQEAVSDQSDASISQPALEIRGDFALGMAAVGQTVVLAAELEKLQAYHANASEIFAALRVVFEMKPDDGLMDTVLKFTEEMKNLRYAEARATDATQARERAHLDTVMYAKAWAWELGEPYRAKTHEIDALVLTTRDRMAALGAANKRVGALEFALREARRSVNYEITNTVSNSHQMDARRALVLVDEALEGKA